MTPNHYDILFEKYLSGNVTADEEQLLEKYLKESPPEERELAFSEKAVVGSRIKKKLLGNTIRKDSGRLIFWVPAAAASILIVLGLIWNFSPMHKIYMASVVTALTDHEEGFEVKNTSGKPIRLTLEDGSEVLLQPNSRISYPEHFGDRRRVVYLHGEAFFNVKRDPSKPFIVSTANLATQVLGTSFNVKSYDRSGSIEVQVASGRVSVYEVPDKKTASRNGFILTPNQKIVFDKESRKMELGIVRNPAVVKPVDSRQKFEFAATPVSEALSILENTYGIDIVIEGEVLKNCLFTGDLNDLPMFQQLDLICKSVNMEYEQRGTSLFVYGEGCVEKL